MTQVKTLCIVIGFILYFFIPSTHKMLWSQQVEEEKAQLLAMLHSSKPMHESSHMPNKMLTLYYDPSDHSSSNDLRDSAKEPIISLLIDFRIEVLS